MGYFTLFLFFVSTLAGINEDVDCAGLGPAQQVTGFNFFYNSLTEENMTKERAREIWNMYEVARNYWKKKAKDMKKECETWQAPTAPPTDSPSNPPTLSPVDSTLTPTSSP